MWCVKVDFEWVKQSHMRKLVGLSCRYCCCYHIKTANGGWSKQYMFKASMMDH